MNCSGCHYSPNNHYRKTRSLRVYTSAPDISGRALITQQPIITSTRWTEMGFQSTFAWRVGDVVTHLRWRPLAVPDWLTKNDMQRTTWLFNMETSRVRAPLFGQMARRKTPVGVCFEYLFPCTGNYQHQKVKSMVVYSNVTIWGSYKLISEWLKLPDQQFSEGRKSVTRKAMKVTTRLILLWEWLWK